MHVTHSNRFLNVTKKAPSGAFFLVSIHMIDTVTVVFQDELPILQVQAQSIDLYCKDLGIKNIFVVVNDDQSIIDQIDTAWWGQFQNQVRIVHRDYFQCEFVQDGWLSQQALKVMASSLSQNDYSMILDAKTIVIKPATIDLVLPGGKPIGGLHPIPEVFSTSARIVGELFGVQLTHNGGSSGVPFLFHNDTVRSMLTEIKTRTGQNFSDWFQAQGMVTEYLLYVGYNLLLHGSMDKFYSLTYPYSVSNLCRNQTNIIDEKLIEMQRPSNLTISVHRYAWATMNQQQKNLYKKILFDHGLTTAENLQ